jgi:predicted transcriptional regulator
MALLMLNMSFNPFALSCSNPINHSFTSVIAKIINTDDSSNNFESDDESNSMLPVEEVKEIMHHDLIHINFDEKVEFCIEQKIFSFYKNNVLMPDLEVLLQPPLSC